jgi:hypothetical protein
MYRKMIGVDGDGSGMPRWVKIAIGIAVLAVVLLVALLLSGQQHGPSRHAGAQEHTATATEEQPRWS